ncbi:hypothetical protein ACFSTI_21110 [Rhizorhabdus histidinilytica]
MSRTLISGGVIVSVDSAIGVLPKGDVLIEGERIVAVGPHVEAGDAEVVDARGMIVMPGLINAHLHSWQSGLRSIGEVGPAPTITGSCTATLPPVSSRKTIISVRCSVRSNSSTAA